MHRPQMTTGASARTTRPNRLDCLAGVRGNVCLDREGRDSDVPADIDPDKLTGTGHAVDVPGFDAKPFGDLGNGQKLTSVVHHRPPSRFGGLVPWWIE